MSELLARRVVEKPWGRTDISPHFAAPLGQRIGEIWFEHPHGKTLSLMAKYLFTSERLSIQVHPDTEQAALAGLASGKDEMWIVLAAEPDAHIGIGLDHAVSREQLRVAALDGTIEDLLDWRPVKAGDVLYNPAGNIHALGPGLTLIEIQQALDLTYRLYDYGRPRPLHLDDGLKVASLEPIKHARIASLGPGLSQKLVDGPFFHVEWCCGMGALSSISPPSAEIQLLAIEGAVAVGNLSVEPGHCALVDDLHAIDIPTGINALLFWPL